MRRVNFLSLFTTVILLSTTLQTEPEMDILEREIAELQDKAYNIHASKFEEEGKEMLEALESIPENICLSGYKPDRLSTQGYLRRFAEGPCAPAVLIPGMLGTQLVATIDCKKLRASDPETFKACGWNSCNGIFKKKPKAEYKVWIPDPLSPMSIVKPTASSKRCFAGLMSFKVVKSGNGIKLQGKEGVKIDTLGTTKGLGDDYRKQLCGFKAIQDFSHPALRIASTHLYGKMRQLMQRAGYKIGLTLQALPYDFRLDARENKLNTKFRRVVNEMHEMVGKKVAMVGYSYGNQQALNLLWNMNQQEKDQKIARYMAVGPPFIGSSEVLKTPFGMDSKYSLSLFGFDFGLTYDSFLHASSAWKSTYSLLPLNHHEIFEGHTFYQDILKKIQAENQGKDPQKGTVMDIFPPINSECVVGVKERSDKCVFGFKNWEDFGSVTGEKITYNNLADKLSQYSYNPQAGEIYKQSRDIRFNTLPNLGVQTNIIFSSSVPTTIKIHYQQDPKLITKKGKPYDPERVEVSGGDGAVPVLSSLLPGIKWANEYRTKSAPGAKPITFVEMCSRYNRKSDIFQGGRGKITKNEYIGVDCKCTGSKSNRKSGESCANHTDLIEDYKVVTFIINSFIDGQKGKVGKRFSSMSEVELLQYQYYCKMFNGY